MVVRAGSRVGERESWPELGGAICGSWSRARGDDEVVARPSRRELVLEFLPPPFLPPRTCAHRPTSCLSVVTLARHRHTLARAGPLCVRAVVRPHRFLHLVLVALAPSALSRSSLSSSELLRCLRVDSIDRPPVSQLSPARPTTRPARPAPSLSRPPHRFALSARPHFCSRGLPLSLLPRAKPDAVCSRPPLLSASPAVPPPGAWGAQELNLASPARARPAVPGRKLSPPTPALSRPHAVHVPPRWRAERAGFAPPLEPLSTYLDRRSLPALVPADAHEELRSFAGPVSRA